MENKDKEKTAMEHADDAIMYAGKAVFWARVAWWSCVVQLIWVGITLVHKYLRS